VIGGRGRAGGAPVTFLTWRKRHAVAFAATLAFLWFTILYVCVFTNLIELGENNRFRFEVEPLRLIVRTVMLIALWQSTRHQWLHPGAKSPHRLLGAG